MGDKTFLENQNNDYVYRELINERIIKIIWHKKLFIDSLKTKDGEDFEILFPGIWNFEEGPDFKGVIIKLGGRKIRGDVEIHKNLSDWHRHKHQENSFFSNVILNVAFWDDVEEDFVFSPIDLKIRQFEVRNFLIKSLKRLIYEIEEDNYPYYEVKKTGYCSRDIGKNLDKVIHLLNLAGEERFQKKVEMVNYKISQVGYENTIYSLFMESLGYKNNKEQFKRLAELVPINTLKDILRSEKDEEERNLILQSIFFHFSGLKDRFLERGIKSNEICDYLRILHKKQEKWSIYFDDNLTGMDNKNWKYYGVRPLNFPERNITGLSLFLTKFMEKGLDNWLFEKVDELRKVKEDAQLKCYIKAFCDELIQAPAKRWDDIFSLSEAKRGKRTKLIGEGKSLSITLNVFLPLMFYLAIKSNDISLKEKVTKLYDIFPALQSNSIVRLMKYRLFGDAQNIRISKEKMQQGLIHIFFNFCEESIWNCESCAFLKKIYGRI